MSKLFSDDEGPVDDDDVQLTINEHYAKAFEYRKEREELEQLKAKYGSDYDPDESSTDSESAESEDEDGEELTPAVDAAILRTLARIKKKDPAIYDSQKNIFGEEREKIASKPSISSKTKIKSKPVTIRQANLESMLHGSRSPSPEADDGPQPLTHVQEQENLRKETIAAFHDAVGDEDGDDFLIPREKTKDEQEREEEEYRAFLEREVGDLRELVSVDGDRDDDEVQVEGGEKEGEPKKKKKKQSKSKETADQQEGTSSGKRKKKKAEEDQEFLMNYILNRGWIDRSEGHIPTYKEITTHDDDDDKMRKRKGKAKAEPSSEGDDEEMDNGLLSDSSFESLASHFEVSYNHRFEEPGAATIPSYPRRLASTVRREDTKRKEARERKKERKEEELAKKREEVKRLKALKMREVKRKLEMIGRQGGLKTKKAEEDNEFVDEALRELDLDGEWNPDQHDRQMLGLFDREVDGDDDAKADEDGKPVWDDDIDIGDIPMSDDDAIYSKKEKKERKKEKKKKKRKDILEEDVGVDIDAMDADVQFDDEEEWDGTEEMRKRKLDEYMDEIYGLEFNDMVGDLPTRFKYTTVKPQNFSLTPVEILLATDQELNEYMGVKRYAPYRQDKETKHFTKSKQEKLWEIKQKAAERSGGAFAAPEAEGGEKEKKKKRKGKKERMKAKGGLTGEEGEEAAPDADTAPAAGASMVNGSSESQKKSKKRKRDHQADHAEDGNVPSSVEPEANGALGVDAAPKKKRKRNKKKGHEDDAAQV